jgi:hypothetical protein
VKKCKKSSAFHGFEWLSARKSCFSALQCYFQNADRHQEFMVIHSQNPSAKTLSSFYEKGCHSHARFQKKSLQNLHFFADAGLNGRECRLDLGYKIVMNLGLVFGQERLG